MNPTDFSLKLNGFPIKKAKTLLGKIQTCSESQYQDYIEARKSLILNHHLNNNTFYQNINSERITSWQDLPILTKKDLQIPLIQRLSNGFNAKNCYTNKTSGSTGDPFYFAIDKFCHAFTWAIFQNRYDWFGLNDQRQARFYGIPKDTKGKYKERIKDFAMNRYRFDVFDLSDHALNNWIDHFKKNNYTYLNGYTTVIVYFAHFLAKKNIILKEFCPSLKAAIVTSEMCSPEDKVVMQRAFGIPIINEYGASELGLIAFENTVDQWTLNTESLFIEVVDEHGKALPDGEVGRIIITSLYNMAHPLIRYELGDIGSIESVSPKKKILKTLQGRKEDLVRLPSGKVAPGLSMYYVTKSVMDDRGSIKEIKVVQNALDQFEIHYSADSALSENQKNDIKQALEQYLEPNLNITFIQYQQLQRSKSGKLKQFTSKLNLGKSNF